MYWKISVGRRGRGQRGEPAWVLAQDPGWLCSSRLESLPQRAGWGEQRHPYSWAKGTWRTCKSELCCLTLSPLSQRSPPPTPLTQIKARQTLSHMLIPEPRVHLSGIYLGHAETHLYVCWSRGCLNVEGVYGKPKLWRLAGVVPGWGAKVEVSRNGFSNLLGSYLVSGPWKSSQLCQKL